MNKYSLIFFVNSVFCFSSLILYFFSPGIYNFYYCLLIMICYFAFNLFFFLFDETIKRVGIGFEFFFFFAFFMANFIYPIFYFNDNPNVSLFSFSFNENIITKSTSLALVGYSFYILGATNYKKVNLLSNLNLKNNNTLGGGYIVLTLMFYLMYVFFGGLELLTGVYKGEADIEEVSLSSYTYVIFEILILTLTWLFFLLNNRALKIASMILIFSVIVGMLLTGSRNLSVAILLIIFCGITRYIVKVPKIIVLILIFIGASIMYFIQLLRSFGGRGDADLAINAFNESSSFFDPFLDLIINNRNLYVLVDFVDNFNYVYFYNILTSLFGFLPSTQIIISLFNIPSYFFSGKFTTFLEFGSNSTFGLGTNMVGEAYLSLGLVGVVLVFFLIGRVVRFFRNGSFTNSYYSLAYFILISQSVFMVRMDYLFWSRKLIWALLFFFLIYQFTILLNKQFKK